MQPPFSTHYQDVYFSRANGLDEKRHVFQGGNDLPARYAGRSDFVIAEAGFGTGLSFLATAQTFLAVTTKTQYLHFYSFEAHPMTAEQLQAALSPWRDVLGPMIDELVSQLPLSVPGWHRLVIGGRVILTLIYGDINHAMPHFNVPVDAWYLDGFNPAKNPDMWGEVLFDTLARCAVPGSTAATYSAARVVKDGLARVGFAVQKQKGFGYKSDMITGRFTGVSTQKPFGAQRGLRVAVLGGGLAATSVAWALRQAGQIPVLIAPHGLADGASGNARGLYNPRFAANVTEMAQFYMTAFARFHHFLAQHDPAQTGWYETGALHLLHNGMTTEKLLGAAKNWGWGEGMQHVDAHEASIIAGIPIAYDAVWIKHSGSVDPRKICALYADGIEIRSDMSRPADYDAVVVANGLAARDDPELQHLPLKPVRGQLAMMRATMQSSLLKTHLCYGGYCTPAIDGMHVVGATFTRDDIGTDVRAADFDQIAQKMTAVLGPVLGRDDVTGGRASLRVTTPDHMPIIGRVADGPVWVSLAHGSHGLLSTHFAAQILADEIAGLSWASGPIRALVAPARFNVSY